MLENKTRSQKGFTLIELLIYSAITAILAGATVGILLTVTQIQIRETNSTEVSNQLNFVLQSIQRSVSFSSNIEIPTGTPVTILKLRTKESPKDPTYICVNNDTVKIQEGFTGVVQNCSDLPVPLDLSSNKVKIDSLKFTKITQYPGHDTVLVNIQVSSNIQNPKGQLSRVLETAVSRVSAATFDSDLLPGAPGVGGNDIGLSGQTWDEIYTQKILVSDGTVTNPSISFINRPGNGLFRPTVPSNTNDLAISSNGIERMRFYGGIVSNLVGNISIGTSAIGVSRLDIFQPATSGYSYNLFLSTDGSNSPGLAFVQGASQSTSGSPKATVVYQEGGAADSIDFTFYTPSPTNIVKIKSNNNVDISGNLNLNSPGGNLTVSGSATIGGNLSKGSGTFLIDHPLDPKNKVLRHSFVESPEARNTYYGQAKTQNNEAIITLPDWWTALNGKNKSEYNYQFTPIGEWCELYVKEEINENKFKVGSRGNDCKFSWTVSGIRHDAFIEAHPIIVEELKVPEQRGICIHPEACTKK